MSVECKVIIGHTVELARDLSHEDFEKCDAFITKYPELDEYNYHRDDMEGKLLLIGDGMNGDFLRLVIVDKYIDDASLGDSNEFFELAKPALPSMEITEKLAALYEEYTGKSLTESDIKYAIWSQWY
jgi:hypothetical protein